MTEKKPSKPHWMVEVLKTSVPNLPDLTAETETAEAWAIARRLSGIDINALTEKVAAHFNMAVADLNSAEPRILKLIPEKLARRYLVFPLQQDDRRLYVATSEPRNLGAEQAIEFASGRTTVFQIAPPKAIEKAIDDRYSLDRKLGNSSIAPDYDLQLTLSKPFTLDIAGSGSTPAAPAKPDVPAAAPSPVPPRITPAPAAATSKQAQVLVVDDDDVTRQLATSILLKQGYLVSEAADGIVALERVADGKPSLIILDLKMPNLGGREVLAKLKGAPSTSEIAVIVMTASDEHDLEAQLMDEGADDYIRKPLDSARFVARVKAVLRRVAVFI